MQADIEIHKAAMSLTPHRRWSFVVGARSALAWSEPASDSNSNSDIVAAGVGLAWSWIAATVNLLRLISQRSGRGRPRSGGSPLRTPLTPTTAVPGTPKTV